MTNEKKIIKEETKEDPISLKSYVITGMNDNEHKINDADYQKKTAYPCTRCGQVEMLTTGEFMSKYIFNPNDLNGEYMNNGRTVKRVPNDERDWGNMFVGGVIGFIIACFVLL